MKAEPWIYSLAKQMLGNDALSQEDECGIQLRDYLEDIETFANLVNGSIQSRQVVALALVHYLDERIGGLNEYTIHDFIGRKSYLVTLPDI